MNKSSDIGKIKYHINDYIKLCYLRPENSGFSKKQETSGLLSNLGIRKLLSKIPLIGYNLF